MRIIRVGAAVAAIGMLGAGCSSSGGTKATGSSVGAGATTASSVKLSAGKNVTIAVITHGDSGSFWSVAKKGVEDAGRDLGITVQYQGSSNDPAKQAQLIDAAVTAKVDGLAVSAPNPDAIKSSLAKAEAAGIPVVTLNSGATVFQSLGAVTHVGQDEGIAGQGAGTKLAAAGGKKLLCIIHEQNNVGLQQRCDGAQKTFGGTVTDFQVAGSSNISQTLSQIQAKLTSDPAVDSVLALDPDIAIAARDGIKAANSKAKLATFDVSKAVIAAIQSGDIVFAIDQQQYLQGYLPVVFLYLYKTNANTVGGGQPVLTGPGFITKDNVDKVAALAAAGTR